MIYGGHALLKHITAADRTIRLSILNQVNTVLKTGTSFSEGGLFDYRMTQNEQECIIMSKEGTTHMIER